MKLKPVTIMVPTIDARTPEEEKREERKNVMAIMAEMNNHLPNVNSDLQEQVAQFMIEQLKGNLTEVPQGDQR